MDYSDKYIKKIYDRSMINRSQIEKKMMENSQAEMDKRFWEFCHARTQRLLEQIVSLYELPNVSKKQIDTAQAEFSKFLDTLRMYTLPEVINQLTMDLMKEKQIILLKKQDKLGEGPMVTG